MNFRNRDLPPTHLKGLLTITAPSCSMRIAMSIADNRDLARFGEKLRILRNRHELTLTQMAEQLGYKTHGYLSQIESGKKLPTVGMALKVARLFGVSTDSLLKDELEIPD